jgi:hypothetical protein
VSTERSRALPGCSQTMQESKDIRKRKKRHTREKPLGLDFPKTVARRLKVVKSAAKLAMISSKHHPTTSSAPAVAASRVEGAQSLAAASLEPSSLGKSSGSGSKRGLGEKAPTTTQVSEVPVPAETTSASPAPVQRPPPLIIEENTAQAGVVTSTTTTLPAIVTTARLASPAVSELSWAQTLHSFDPTKAVLEPSSPVEQHYSSAA